MLTIEAHGLGKYRGGRCVLAGLELSVSPGERLFILGENGCGKSTLLQILTGVLEADLGRVEVRGTVGYAPEKPDLPGHLLVEEWLESRGLAQAAPLARAGGIRRRGLAPTEGRRAIAWPAPARLSGQRVDGPSRCVGSR